MEIGDLVKQKDAGTSLISEYLRSSLSMGCIGIVIKVHNRNDLSYDNRSIGDLTVQWSNGKIETLPEVYLEKIENEK